MNIISISYKHGMLNKASQRKKLKAVYFVGDDISPEIKSLIAENDILSLSGVIGSKEGGMPIEYEAVTIRAEGETTSFEVYNKGLSVIHFNTPELQRVFPLCSRLHQKVRT